MNVKGRVCGVTKEGGHGVDPSMLAAMMEAAQRQGPLLIDSMLKYLAAEANKARH